LKTTSAKTASKAQLKRAGKGRRAFGKGAVMLELAIILILFIVVLLIFLKMLSDITKT
jgi:hypothetical protein